MTEVLRYPASLRALHWAVVVLMALQFAIFLIGMLFAQTTPGLIAAARTATISIWVLILGMMLVRLGLRLALPVPPLPITIGRRQRRLARGTHFALYAILIVLPVTAWLQLAALGYPMRAFHLVPLPTLEFMPDVARRARRAHDLLLAGLGGLLILHIAAALFHRRIFGIAVLPRMGVCQRP